MVQWPNAAIHDRVAAIVSRPPFGSRRESLIGRFLRWLFDQFVRLMDTLHASMDGRIVLLAVALAVIALVVARVLVERQAAVRRARAAARIGRPVASADAWKAAASLAESGEYVAASHALYGAVLDALRTGRWIEYHRSKTAGDYARELRRSSPATAQDFRAFARDFDRVAFGTSPATREDYERLLHAAQALASHPRRAAAA